MAGIYLHIPFCKRRCIYCDFYSSTDSSRAPAYINALKTELEARRDYLGNERVETIYFGGGTPSQLDASDIGGLITHIRRTFDTSDMAEITVEANPDDMTSDYLSRLREAGANRISIGVQSFDDKRLAFLRRRHDAAQACRAVEACYHNGFDNVSIDLIYGLPDESCDQWTNDLRQAVSLGVEHISAYHIIYEDGTPLTDMLGRHEIRQTNEDESVRQFETMCDILSGAGYIHYEISNFCLPGRHSRHNTAYWQNKPYLGCGASAHSYNLATRQWNVRDITAYIDGVTHEGVYYEVEQLDTATRYNEYVMVSLRTMWGADTHVIASRYGQEFADLFVTAAEKHISGGCLAVEGTIFRLTRHGILLSDRVISDLMCVV